jgi:hypothetical protein
MVAIGPKEAQLRAQREGKHPGRFAKKTAGPKPPKGPRNLKAGGFTNSLWRLEERTKVVTEKQKGGRPPTVEGKPWEAEGVSRRTWYRKKKK